MSGLSDGDLDRIERMLEYGIVGEMPNVSGATVQDVAEAADALVAEVRRLRAVHEDDVSRLMLAGVTVGRLEARLAVYETADQENHDG